MKGSACFFTVLLALLIAMPARAADIVKYTEIDGEIKTASVLLVRKDTEDEFNARVLLKGKSRTLKIPSRLVIEFRRGSSEDINQWSKRLATGKRRLAAGQLVTRGPELGAEELFEKVAYTMEKGTPGQEKTEAVSPWHNMYAMYYLIETRFRIGTPESLAAALKNIDEFEKRTDAKKGKKLKVQVPAEKGTTRQGEVYGWGDTRLLPEVMLYRARILAAQKNGPEAAQAFDDLIDRVKKAKLSPVLLVAAINGKADLEAEGKSSEEQEQGFASAGNALASLVSAQPDAYGKEVLTKAANRLFLRGADLLLQSAGEGTVSFDLPLSRYRKLKEGLGRKDPALMIGAMAGIGICMTEKGQGQEAYETLLDVVVKGHEHPEQMARSLYYLGKAAPLYADQIESQGGKGDFLRAEAARWHADLRDRYPSSNWAEKVPAK